MSVNNLINLENVIEWRNHMHQNPELSFEEIKTSQYIFDILSSFDGLSITRPTKTSVVAELDTKIPGRSIAFRADIDALAVHETSDVNYKSQVDNVMHACGHDTHAAMLLGAIEVACKLVKEDKLTGKLKFIFQHAEEVPPGGASELVALGVMDDVDEIYGLHVGGSFPVGFVGITPGYMTASCDSFSLKMHGIGSHGSTPEKAIDLITVSAQLINALQTIVSRNISALDSAVVTIGSINIGNADNVIANEGIMTGTIRTQSNEIREFVHQRIEKNIKAICEANDVKYELVIEKGYSSIFNSEKQLETLKNAASKVSGTTVEELAPLMGSEDFSAYLSKKPGAFSFIGAGGNFFNHHPEFMVEEKALEIGAAIHLQIMLDLLGK